MNKHTPGPWKREGTDWINTPDSGGFRVELINCQNYTVAQVLVDEGDETQKDNARLIAAAPALLKCLQEVYEDLGSGEMSDSPFWRRRRTHIKAIIDYATVND